MDVFNHSFWKLYIKIINDLDPGLNLPELNQYLHVRGSSPGPLFLLSESTPLHREWLTYSIQSILSAAGVPGHSFCISAATSAGSGDLPDHVIKTLGTWSIDLYQIYIHTPTSTIVGVASLLT